jgi:hypothetical protein
VSVVPFKTAISPKILSPFRFCQKIFHISGHESGRNHDEPKATEESSDPELSKDFAEESLNLPMSSSSRALNFNTGPPAI